MKDDITKSIMELRGQIAGACDRYNRDADDITVIAVSKTHSAAAIKVAVAAGIRNIGESRLQEAEPKITELGRIARFHMVGHLQTNKVKKAVRLFDVIQSVDSMKLAEEINCQAELIAHKIECLIEVNCSGEEQKYGVNPDECLALVEQVNGLSYINLAGLMTVGPYSDNEEDIRSAFKLCKALFDRGRDIVGDQFDTLSMGMSGDFPLAIAEGATMIRVGTSIFGLRENRE